jgi:hypothetical protein
VIIAIVAKIGLAIPGPLPELVMRLSGSPCVSATSVEGGLGRVKTELEKVRMRCDSVRRRIWPCPVPVWQASA